MNKVVFGEKVGAKYMSFMIDPQEKELHSAWFSLIEGNGKMMTIVDKTAPVGLMEAETRYKAVKQAKQFLEKMKN